MIVARNRSVGSREGPSTDKSVPSNGIERGAGYRDRSEEAGSPQYDINTGISPTVCDGTRISP